VNTGGCSNTSALLPITDSAVAKLFIFPSPNQGRFEVTYYSNTTTASRHLLVYDSKGARVYSKAFVANGAYYREPVDMRGRGKGVYRVVLLDKDGKTIATGSVVIQ